MLERLRVRGFKSLSDVELRLPRLTVLFGPNAAGKSNFLDAIQALSSLGTGDSLSEALAAPIRGYPIEAFSFPSGGLPELLSQPSATFELEATLAVAKKKYEYRIEVQIDVASGSLSVADESLIEVSARGTLREALIERVGSQLLVRRRGRPASPRMEALGLGRTVLSDPRLAGSEYSGIEACRRELFGWRSYYLDPRIVMRRAAPPAERNDIGSLGWDIAPFLYRLRAEEGQRFEALVRTLRTLIPSIERLDVDLDKKRGTLDLLIRQNGIDFSSRIVSEGTLRVLGLCAIAVNPWSGPLLAFEEPENGVHPRRLELIAELLAGMAIEQGKQVVVTTHSPLFCSAVLQRARQDPGEIGLFRVRQTERGTDVTPFEVAGPLFEDAELLQGLTAAAEDGIFEGLMIRGLLDE